MATGGQYALASGGQFALVLGGQFEWFFHIIDVRDVADLHILAMTNPKAKGQRFLALAGGKISLPEIAVFLKEKIPEAAKNISTKKLPDWVVKVGGFFSPKLKNVASMLKTSRNTSNEKAKNILGWKPIATNEEAIIESVKSMLKFGNLK